MLARSSLAVAALITVLLATRQLDETTYLVTYLQARHAELAPASSTRAVGTVAGAAATTTRAHIEHAISAAAPAPPVTIAAPPPLAAPATTEAPAVAAAPSVDATVVVPRPAVVRHLPLEPMRPPAGARNGSVSGRSAAFGPDGIWRDWSDDGPSGGAGDFSGAPSLDERSQLLAGCRGVSKCGFMAPSGFDALREPQGYEGCAVVVLTAIFGRKDKLQQPGRVPSGQEHCYFAFVDAASASFLVQTAPRSIRRGSSSARIGSWRLLVLSPPAPYADPRRNSRVPKLLPSRLFPAANYSLWLDGKLKLLVPPMQLVERFLLRPRASIALPRNLRRDHISEELAWIRGTLGAKPEQLASDAAKAVERQWSFYQAEQAVTHPLHQTEKAGARIGGGGGSGGGGGGGSGGGGSVSGGRSGARVDGTTEWAERTVCVEGAMILTRLRSRLAQCVMCAWFNEWHRFGERDQLSFSYVMLAMNLTPAAPDDPIGIDARHADGATGAVARRSGATGAASGATLDAATGSTAAGGGADAEEGAGRRPERGTARAAADWREATYEPPARVTAHHGVYVWPRSDHWRAKRRSGERKKWRYVHYAGHGGPGE